NRDMLISTIAATLAAAITGVARMAYFASFFGGSRDEDGERGGNPLVLILFSILAPIAAFLIQMAVSRAREFQADESGARLAGRASGLAGALEKIEVASRAEPLPASPATAHLFIVNPLTGQSFARLFSTHPPTEERIARLRAMRLRRCRPGRLPPPRDRAHALPGDDHRPRRCLPARARVGGAELPAPRLPRRRVPRRSRLDPGGTDGRGRAPESRMEDHAGAGARHRRVLPRGDRGL